MKFFPSFFESRASKRSEQCVHVRKKPSAVEVQEAHDKDAIAKAYLNYGPRVARHMARNIKNSSKEGHTCPRSELLVLH